MNSLTAYDNAQHMRQVTKAEFFSVIGPRDVHPRLVGRYPYTSIFEDQRTRVEVGRIVPDGRVEIYFLAAKAGA